MRVEGILTDNPKGLLFGCSLTLGVEGLKRSGGHQSVKVIDCKCEIFKQIFELST